jgi:hypothetical protein
VDAHNLLWLPPVRLSRSPGGPPGLRPLPYVVWENLTRGSESLCCGYSLKVPMPHLKKILLTSSFLRQGNRGGIGVKRKLFLINIILKKIKFRIKSRDKVTYLSPSFFRVYFLEVVQFPYGFIRRANFIIIHHRYFYNFKKLYSGFLLGQNRKTVTFIAIF